MVKVDGVDVCQCAGLDEAFITAFSMYFVCVYVCVLYVLLKPGDELDHMSLDTYTVDDNLYVGLRHLV